MCRMRRTSALLVAAHAARSRRCSSGESCLLPKRVRSYCAAMYSIPPAEGRSRARPAAYARGVSCGAGARPANDARRRLCSHARSAGASPRRRHCHTATPPAIAARAIAASSSRPTSRTVAGVIAPAASPIHETPGVVRMLDPPSAGAGGSGGSAGICVWATDGRGTSGCDDVGLNSTQPAPGKEHFRPGERLLERDVVRAVRLPRRRVEHVPGREPRRDAERAQHDRHRRRGVVVVAALRVEQVVVDEVAPIRRRRDAVVDRERAQVRLDRGRRVVRVRRPGGDLLCERADARRACASRPADSSA